MKKKLVKKLKKRIKVNSNICSICSGKAKTKTKCCSSDMLTEDKSVWNI